MLKKIFLLQLLFAIVVSGYAQNSPVKYTSPGKNFSATFPQTPEESVDTISLSTGLSTIYYYMAQPSEMELYMVSRTDVRLTEAITDMKASLEASRDGATKNMKATDVKTISMDTKSKYPNIFFTCKAGTMQARMRIYMDNSIQYSVLTLNAVDAPESPAVKVFFDSFKILDPVTRQ